jgi:hypothetical protein
VSDTGIEFPGVKNTLIDEKNDVRYEVLAYRRLSEEELVLAVRMFLTSRRRNRRIKRGTLVQIVSVIGCGELR